VHQHDVMLEMVKGHGGKVKEDVSVVSPNLQVQQANHEMDFGAWQTEYEANLQVVMLTLNGKSPLANCFNALGTEYEPSLMNVINRTKSDQR